MLAKKSALILKDFFLLGQNIRFNQPDESNTNVVISEITDQYQINLDYSLKKVEGTFFQMFVKVEINLGENQLPGYSIFCEGVGIFDFNESQIKSENDKVSLLYLSGLSICINSLRSIIAGVTSHCPFGKYTFPSIDVNQLLKDKNVFKKS